MEFFNLLKRYAYPIFFQVTLLLLVVISIALQNNIDFDLWGRLINGRHVVEVGTPCFNDILSYIPRHTWYDPEWLTGALMYLVQSNFGLHGLNVLNFITGYLIILSLFFAIKNIYKNVASPYFILFYLSVILVLSDIIFGVLRCQVVTYILISIWILMLETIRKGNNKLLFLLPLIMLFWLNTHGGCIAGVGILILYIIGEALNKKPWKKYLIALIPTCLVFLVNPWGFEYIEFMINSAFIDRTGIAEWGSLFKSLREGDFYFYVFFIVVLLASYLTKLKIENKNWQDIDKTKLLNILILIYLSFSHVKHIPLLLIIVGILTYGDLVFCVELLWQKLIKKFNFFANKKTILILTFRCLIYLALYLHILLKLILSPFDFIVKRNIPDFYPIQIVNFLQVNQIKGTLFAEFGVSSFFGYKLYPNIKIMYDGREEQVYPPEMLQDVNDVLLWRGKNPLHIIQKYKPDILILTQGEEYAKHIEKFKGYQLIYFSFPFHIYTKKELVKKDYDFSSVDTDYFIDNIFFTNIDFKHKKEQETK